MLTIHHSTHLRLFVNSCNCIIIIHIVNSFKDNYNVTFKNNNDKNNLHQLELNFDSPAVLFITYCIAKSIRISILFHSFSLPLTELINCTLVDLTMNHYMCY